VLVAAAGSGCGLVVARAGLATLTQQLVPDEVRGRVESAVNMIVSVSAAASQGLAGVLGDPHFFWCARRVHRRGRRHADGRHRAIYALRGAVRAVASKVISG